MNNVICYFRTIERITIDSVACGVNPYVALQGCMDIMLQMSPALQNYICLLADFCHFMGIYC